MTEREIAQSTSSRAVSPVRVVVVTLGLAAAGGVAGAVVAIATFTLLAWATNGPLFDLVAYLVTGMVGAACVVVLGPIVAWLCCALFRSARPYFRLRSGPGALLAAIRLRLTHRGV